MNRAELIRQIRQLGGTAEPYSDGTLHLGGIMQPEEVVMDQHFKGLVASMQDFIAHAQAIRELEVEEGVRTGSLLKALANTRENGIVEEFMFSARYIEDLKGEL